jgi:(E)-4-hydroxy-3-methylbut-2-enyl-diphosphate synthase
MIYLNGKPVYKLDNKALIEHIVELCEKKAKEIEDARNSALESAP